MKVMAAGKAKNAFGLLIDTARAEPVTIEKHGRAVAVMLSVEEYERLKNVELRSATNVDRLGVPADDVKSNDQKAG